MSWCDTVIVEGMDRAHWATLNFFTETLRGTHPAPANIMDYLWQLTALPNARERCVACSSPYAAILGPFYGFYGLTTYN